MNRSLLLESAELRGGATREEIDQAETELGLTLPSEYRALLAESNGLRPQGGHTDRYDLALFAAAELAEMNTAYEVPDYLPGHLLIGLDGGGRGIFLDTAAEPSPVYLCEMGALFPDDLRRLADSLEAWMRTGWDLGDPEPTRHPERIDIYLLRPPAAGMKALVRILKLLDQNVSMSEYRKILASTPYRLVRNVTYMPYSWRCAEFNQEDPCLGAFEVDRPDCPVAIGRRG